MDEIKALRFNAGKLRWELLPVEWQEELVKVFSKGAVKYKPDNWKNSIGTEDSTQFKQDRLGSALRHIAAYRKGELLDSEVVEGAEHIPTYHLAHAAWNLLAILYYDLKDNTDAVYSS
jgi:hypothetical protein